LRLDLSSESEIINELQTHIEDRFDEMREAGLSEEEAADTCLKLLGSARSLARQIYEAHSQGTWKQVLLASMPHLFFALLFVLNWWQAVGWLVISLAFILTVAVYGWRHGRPIWLFPWLGYYLVPVAVAGLLLLYLPKGWSWIAILLYLPVVLWLVGAIAIQAIKKDWLYGALMMLPVPIIIGWFMAVEQEGGFFQLSLERIRYFAPWIGLSFLALAVTVAAFVRVRQRWLRAALLLVSGFLTLLMVTCYADGRLGLLTFSILSLVMLGLLLSPALVERRIRHGNMPPGGEPADAKSSHHNR